MGSESAGCFFLAVPAVEPFQALFQACARLETEQPPCLGDIRVGKRNIARGRGFLHHVGLSSDDLLDQGDKASHRNGTGVAQVDDSQASSASRAASTPATMSSM